ncbi:unnamed protein product [Brassicogethes aeneus]|uniref:UDP-glucuronosyltransferase n=1 Tax=Brassicogethes aeneus TaxID=1431903 RepID=A0A9P0FJQ3_BRAAE|nr:unnamed protein product [Brassicogethes aeneus]
MIKLLLTIVCCVAAVNSAKIIGIFMTPSYSHQVVFQPIWKELSLQGHDVTVITTNPLNDPTLVNLTEIDIGDFSYAEWKKSSLLTLGLRPHSVTEELQEISKAYMNLSHVQLSHPIFQEIIKNQSKHHYDLFLVEYLWPSMYPFKDIFNCPMVGILSLPMVSSSYSYMGMPHHPVLDPDMILPFATDLSFQERIGSVAFNLVFKLAGAIQLAPKINALNRKYFGEHVRPYRDIAKEVSLVIVNSNMVNANIKPLIPQVIEISGIHIKPKKPLPKDLKASLDNAQQGVIYFSLGTNMKSNSLPKEKTKLFLDAFAELPYKVIWKFETDDISDLPKNVEVWKWLPQQDLLGHKNIKLFITQAGIQSIDESMYNKVPLLAIPFFADQRFNADKVTKNGGGLSLDYHSFTKEELKEKILTIIEDKKYKKRVEKLAAIAFDHSVSPLEKAVWHVNYVLRHDGAGHLRYKGLDIPTYQYFMLDVIAVFLIVILFVFLTLLKISQFAIRKLKKLYSAYDAMFFGKSKTL